jgi:hypothetical protein
VEALPHAPAAATQPVLTAVSVSPGAVAVRGLDLVPVTVNITFSNTAWGDPDSVVLVRTTHRAWDRSAPRALVGMLARSAGTGSSGTFSGTVRVPSSAHGDWRVGFVGWPAPFGAAIDVRSAGVPDATLSVTGTHRPRMRYSVSPQPLPYPQTRATVRVLISFDDTRTPVAGLPVGFGLDNSCAERIGPDVTVRTDPHGVATRSIRVFGLYGSCAWAPFPGSTAFLSFPGWATAGGRLRLGTVTSASPSRTSARRRSPVAVTGKATAIVVPLAANGAAAVALQRRVGRDWRTVGGGVLRANGHFTLTANPPRGRSLYRVRLENSYWYASSTSRTFTITGT